MSQCECAFETTIKEDERTCPSTSTPSQERHQEHCALEVSTNLTLELSRTIMMSEHVRAVEMTCRPRPVVIVDVDKRIQRNEEGGQNRV